MASGVTAALSYVFSFIATKTYYDLETSLSLPGVALFNCVIIGAGFILMYKILPETEDRTLEDIELHFSDDSKKLTDRNIPKSIKLKNDASGFSIGTVSIAVNDSTNKIHPQNSCDNNGFISDH